MDMELQFPADARDALVRSGRNISDAERGGGHADGALRPVTPSWAGLDAGVPWRAATKTPRLTAVANSSDEQTAVGYRFLPTPN